MPLNNLSTPLTRWCRYISLYPYSNESKTIEGLKNFAPLRDGSKTFLPTPSYQIFKCSKYPQNKTRLPFLHNRNFAPPLRGGKKIAPSLKVVKNGLISFAPHHPRPLFAAHK